MKTSNTVFAIFKGKSAAEGATAFLRDSGFPSESISMVLPRKAGQKDFQVDVSRRYGSSAGMGGLFGALAGIVLSILLIYFFDYRQSTLNPTAIAALSIVFGALFGAAAMLLVRIGTPDRLHERYINYMDDGGVLVSVRVGHPEREKEALRILEVTGGAEVHSISNDNQIWQSIFRKTDDADRSQRKSKRVRFLSQSTHP